MCWIRLRGAGLFRGSFHLNWEANRSRPRLVVIDGDIEILGYMRDLLALTVLCAVAGSVAGPRLVMAQGPSLSYFYDPATELSWGECLAYQPGGSRQKIPSIPAVIGDPVRAPSGTRGYTTDIAFDGPLVFLGDGIVGNDRADPYEGLNAQGAVVLMSLDAPEQAGDLGLLERRVMNAVDRGAIAVVVFPLENKTRSPVLRLEAFPGFRDLVPVISVSHETATRILVSGSPIADSLLRDWQERAKPPPSESMTVRLKCSFTGRFKRVDTPRFSIRYRDDAFTEREISEVARANEESVTFLLELFEPEELHWTKVPTTYFRGFDSKVFYTRHWGAGLATSTGSFLVYEGAPDFGLIVHENAHTLLDRNWGETISFLSEGVGKYAEAQATDPITNHRDTYAYLQAGKWFPLEEMVTFSIGKPGLETEVGYSAAGSFVGYLIDAHGLAAFKRICRLEGERIGVEGTQSSWEQVYGKGLDQLENAWIFWLEHRLGL